jgi:urate oxidase
MGIVLGTNQYGKAECRLLTVTRTGATHHIKDLNVGIALRGDFAACHKSGDNAHILATDTQKNTVYAFAKDPGVGEVEDFALLLGRHFVGTSPHIHAAQIRIEQYPWDRVRSPGPAAASTAAGPAATEPAGPAGTADAAAHPHAFTRGGGEARTTLVTVERTGTGGASGAPDPGSDPGPDPGPDPGGVTATVVSGLSGLVVLKSTGSEFRGFVRDRYTTLPETDDRILATAVTARWRYGRATDVDWAAAFTAARSTLIGTFADNYSRSLQQTLYDMGEAVLRDQPEIAEIRMSMPNRHHFAVDLSPFGLDNPNEVFFPADRPYGLIEGTVARDDGPAPDQTTEGGGSPWNFSSH